MKHCWICKKQKEYFLFGKNKSKKDGFASECKECKKIKDKEYAEKNKEKINDRAKQWYRNNTEKAKEKSKLNGKKWRENNKEKHCNKNNRYRASKLQAVPKWVDEEHLWLIQEVYCLAKLRSKETNKTWHVDHIVPLKGKNVCGLHVVENLRVVLADENLKKGNKHVCL